MISVVIPCHNEEPVLDALMARLIPVLEGLGEYELIFTDDGSTDGTLAKLEAFAERNPRIKVISFSRNFGHQAAISAGIEHSSGDCVITMDADLQDPPEVIPEMVRKWKEGFQLVYGYRTSRGRDTLFKSITARLFYWLMKALSGVDVPQDSGDFRLMDRALADQIKGLREHHRMLRIFTAWTGFRSTGVPYERGDRVAGQTKYTLTRMIKFAWDGITSFSYWPLQMATWLGLVSALFSFAGIIWVIVVKILGKAIPGWASIAVLVLFLGGIQLLVLGVIGEYLGRIYDEVRARPLYIVAKRINF
ncbi:MAG: glycosyltransferase family 2 protein [candidate division WOR-3 bacterium]